MLNYDKINAALIGIFLRLTTQDEPNKDYEEGVLDAYRSVLATTEYAPQYKVRHEAARAFAEKIYEDYILG